MGYKFFNTIIDDVFSFVVEMPLSHRIACFRDDAVFLVFLWQLWAYRVDKTRANEFGMAYEDAAPQICGDGASQPPEPTKDNAHALPETGGGGGAGGATSAAALAEDEPR